MVGKKIAGYRYGKAPTGGFSRNTQTGRCECGISMAQVGFLPESRSFAVSNLKEKGIRRYYYHGEITGFGGDDEICLINIRQITFAEYQKLQKETIEGHNSIVDRLQERENFLLARGYNIIPRNWKQYRIQPSPQG
jgi:hypothetical protein